MKTNQIEVSRQGDVRILAANNVVVNPNLQYIELQVDKHDTQILKFMLDVSKTMIRLFVYFKVEDLTIISILLNNLDYVPTDIICINKGVNNGADIRITLVKAKNSNSKCVSVDFDVDINQFLKNLSDKNFKEFCFCLRNLIMYDGTVIDSNDFYIKKDIDDNSFKIYLSPNDDVINSEDIKSAIMTIPNQNNGSDDIVFPMYFNELSDWSDYFKQKPKMKTYG